MDPKITRIIRWIARTWATLMAAMILVIFIGEGIHDGIGPFFQLTLKESLMMAAFWITWLGLVLAWKWERTGGSLIIAGMAAFYLIDFGFSGSFPRGPFFLIIALPGVLFLLSSLGTSPEIP